MNKQNYLYGIIGLLVGLLIGYIGSDAINRSAPNPSAAVASGNESELPANHPPADGGGSGVADSTANSSANSSSGPQADVIAAIEKARKEPSNLEAQMKAAELFKQIGRDEGALEFYERAVRVKPKELNLLTTLGNINFDLKRYAEAGKWYQSALKVNPGDATVWMDLGSSYYLREPRDLDKAINAYRSALEADPRHEKSLQNLTRALIDKGDKAAARDSLKQLEQVNPNNQSITQLRTEMN